jgi:hypothetical protein
VKAHLLICYSKWHTSLDPAPGSRVYNDPMSRQTLAALTLTLSVVALVKAVRDAGFEVKKK